MNLITIIVILAVIIIPLIMLQSKGTGLSIIPNSNDFGKFERRWAEKTVYNITIALVVLFIAFAIAQYLLA